MRSRADIVFGPARVAVFVDGCFWHCCPEHATRPRNNAGWWDAKLAANVDRDRRVDDTLAKAGWLSLRIWEHEDVDTAAAYVIAKVRDRTLRPKDSLDSSTGSATS